MATNINENLSPFARAQSSGLVSNVPIQRTRDGGRPTADQELRWVEPFLNAIASGYSMTNACRKAGIATVNARRRYKSDRVFRQAWNEAAQIATKNLEQEAQRRAYHGTLKPVYQKGVRVGCIREYSDTLMIFLLKARKPMVYREGAEDDVGNRNVTINVMNVSTEQAPPKPVTEVQGIGIEVVPSGATETGDKHAVKSA